jgi:hypothetical protein
MESLSIVNLFFKELRQLAQLDQAGWMQDGGLRQQAGKSRWGSLVGPLSRQSDRAFLFSKEGEDFATSRPAHLEDGKSSSPQWMKRVRDGRPSQRRVRTECSLLGVSPSCGTAPCKRSTRWP